MLTFVFDIDGTVLNSKIEMSPNTISSLKKLKDKNFNIIFASGRMYASMRYIIEKYVPFLKGYSPLIAYNGTYIVNHDLKTLFEMGIKKELAVDCINFLKSKNIHVQAYINDKLFVDANNEKIKNYSKHASVGYHVVDNLTDYIISSTHPPLKLLIIESPEKTDKIKRELKEKFNNELNVFSSFDTYIDIIPKNTTKGLGIKRLSEYYDFDLNKCYAFGDSQNDVSMFEIINNSYAMGNAKDEVKKFAKNVTFSNDEDGISHAIEKILNDYYYSVSFG